jgi:hypothetical protein
VLFLDYVRMVRARKDLDWSTQLSADELRFVNAKIDLDAWYPMPVFERLGNAILALVAADQMELVRLWGYHSVDGLCAKEPDLLAAGDPVESLMRFRVLRSTFFDFEALQVPMLVPDEAQVVIAYGMGNPAEEAASWQTMGFFQRLLELAGGTEVRADFIEKSWAGDARTLLVLAWTI